MSKRAEEAALKAYPKKMGMFYEADIHYEADLNKAARFKFIEGYEQAEKDLALTWEDVQLIWQLCDIVNEERPTLCGSHDFFTEVLKRYNEKRINEQRNGL